MCTQDSQIELLQQTTQKLTSENEQMKLSHKEQMHSMQLAISAAENKAKEHSDRAEQSIREFVEKEKRYLQLPPDDHPNASGHTLPTPPPLRTVVLFFVRGSSASATPPPRRRSTICSTKVVPHFGKVAMMMSLGR